MNRLYKKMTMACLMAGLMTSCIYEDEVPCECSVRFVYDYNMEYTDAFAEEVKDVKLYIFDADGTFVAFKEESGNLGSGYKMNLSLDAGEYQLIAWTGSDADMSDFDFPSLTKGQSTKADLYAALNCSNSTSSTDLTDLWYGTTSGFIVTNLENESTTVNLIKDTNRLNVTVTDNSGTELDPEDFDIYLTADNGRMDYDNSLVSIGDIAYKSYSITTRTDDSDLTSSVLGNISTCRFLDDADVTLTIDDNGAGGSIFSTDIIYYIDLMRQELYPDMSLQEYLDREDTFDIGINIARKTGSYIVVSISINSWAYIFNNTQL